MAPTMVASAESNWPATTTPKSTGSITWLTDDLIVVYGGVGDEASQLDLPTITGGPTLSQIAFTNNGSGSFCDCWVWTGVATSGGTATVDGNKSAGPSAWGMGVCVWRGATGIGDITIDTSTTQTVSMDRSGTDSGIMFGGFDWSATASAPTWTPSGQTAIEEATHGSSYSVYVGHWSSQGAPGTTSYGISNASVGSFAKIGVEILGASGPPVEGPHNSNALHLMGPAYY